MATLQTLTGPGPRQGENPLFWFSLYIFIFTLCYPVLYIYIYTSYIGIYIYNIYMYLLVLGEIVLKVLNLLQARLSVTVCVFLFVSFY